MSNKEFGVTARMSGVRAAALVVAAGLVATPVVVATASQAAPKDQILCTRSDYKCDHSGYGRVADKSFWTMASGHNCTNYVSWRLIRDGAPRGMRDMHNGGDWAKDARAKGVGVDQNPTPGSVAQWRSGAPGVSGSGHVAYVEAVAPDSITITEDNYSSGPLQVRVIHRGSPTWPTHFIHFTVPAGAGAPVSAPVPGFPAFNWMNAWFPELANSPASVRA